MENSQETQPEYDFVAVEQQQQQQQQQQSTGTTTTSFQRDNLWLEKATDKFLSKNNNNDFITMEDVHEVKGLMSAWARRASPLVVESLLKRIIDDMRAGNTAIFVSTRFYAIVSNSSSIIIIIMIYMSRSDVLLHCV